MSCKAESQSQNHGKGIGTFIGWAAVLWVAFCVGPYLYAFSDLVQWR